MTAYTPPPQKPARALRWLGYGLWAAAAVGVVLAGDAVVWVIWALYRG